MSKRLGHIIGIVLLALVMVVQPFSAPAVSAHGDPPGNQFVKRIGAELWLQGKPFHFAGSNNYYLMYKSQFMVDDVLNTAAANQFKVLRIWGSLDIGDPNDPSTSISEGVYFQYWDPAAGVPAYNDGDTGLKHLDYVVAKAGQLDLKLVIPFVNNWNDFGGIDQYVRWRDISTPDDQTWYHDSFYTDPVLKGWYKNWIAHLLNRTNTYTGVQYKNDPTIMTWELGNEPRCKSAGAYPQSTSCTTQTLIDWANELSTFIKSVDRNHLVSVGDEGFYCTPGATDWTENCGEGVDTIAFTKLKNIDVMSFHLYPDSWGKDVAWSTLWIKRHIQEAKAIHKPSMLGEYGFRNKAMRNPVYKEWTDTVFQNGGNGALYWILSGKQDDGTYYADYDGFTVYCPSPVCITLRNFAWTMRAHLPIPFPPVADNDTAITEFNTPVTLDPAANDIAYKPAKIVTGTIDLDPTTPGQQTTRNISAGNFVLQPNGAVLFTPTAEFSGRTVITYTIRDSFHRLSNPVELTAIVKPNPSAPIKMFSFEMGVEGWAAANWNDVGTVEQSPDFHTDGNYGLKINATAGGWFGLDFPAPVDLSTKGNLRFDIKTLGAGTSKEVAIKVGDSWTWCEGGGWEWAPADTTATVDINLLTGLGCASPDLSKVQGMYVWFSGPGTFYMDYVRGE